MIWHTRIDQPKRITLTVGDETVEVDLSVDRDKRVRCRITAGERVKITLARLREVMRKPKKP